MNKNKKRLYITENEDGFKFSEKKRIVSFNRVAFLFFFIALNFADLDGGFNFNS